MKLMFKESVRLNPLLHLDGQMRRIIWALVETAPPLIGDTLAITSANDSRHGTRSLHYQDRAFDVRFTGIRPGGVAVPVGTAEAQVAGFQLAAAKDWAFRLRVKLGRDFDVVVEADHLHVEHDPK